jgi:putative ATP-dependent endonuclease of the OLD family
MRITEIAVKNFRLLEDVTLCLEEGATVIVGRNNSGKTSLTELFRRLLSEKAVTFRLEDFSLGVLEQFWDAYDLWKRKEEEPDVRQALPHIGTTLNVTYGRDEDLGPLSDFIIDLDEECTSARLNIRYALAPGKMSQLFDGLDDDKPAFFKALKERIPKVFKASVEAEDPNDSTNRKIVDTSHLRALLQFGFINAQRTLDEVSDKGRAVLGKVFEKLFITASSETATTEDQESANALKTATDDVQAQIDEKFNKEMKKLAPAFELFGYPGLADPNLRTETLLQVEQLFSNHTTVGYPGVHGINLPESYNGLGPRNLIFILLKLFECFKEFANRQPASGVHLVFIEEPEAHLHPQMQSVFIRKLKELREVFADRYNNGNPWPVQFVVTTHSSHIANETSFDSMRYFLTEARQEGMELFTTKVKDLQLGLDGEENDTREFLHKYMTLTRCDLLFADRAILIEGTTERLLLPEMIRKLDSAAGEGDAKLGSQYLSVIEVGGAHAHRFFRLLDFLSLRTLIITDLDSTKPKRGKDKDGKATTKWVKCRVSEGKESSNSCINNWFQDTSDSKKKSCKELLEMSAAQKMAGKRRLAYQVPHVDGDACGRSFEDAFMLANADKFEVAAAMTDERESNAWEKAAKVDKTDFALMYAISDTEWAIPLYIDEGLRWLAETPVVEPAAESASEVEEDSDA